MRPAPTATEAAEGSQAVEHSSVSALCFLLYDICLTFEDEVDIFWPREWTFIKFDFFFLRYFPFLAQIPLLLVGSELTERFHFSRRGCFIWQVYEGVVPVLIIVACDLVFLARIHALYFGNNYIKGLLLFCFALEIIGICVGLGFALPGIHFNEICFVTDVSTGILFYGGAVIVFQTVLFVLTLYKYIEGVRAVPTVKLLMRDGTWAFFALFALIVLQAFLYSSKYHNFAAALYPWILTSYSVSGYRILLNINSLTRQSYDANTSGALASNDIEFHHSLDDDDELSIEIPTLPLSRRD